MLIKTKKNSSVPYKEEQKITINTQTCIVPRSAVLDTVITCSRWPGVGGGVVSALTYFLAVRSQQLPVHKKAGLHQYICLPEESAP